MWVCADGAGLYGAQVYRPEAGCGEAVSGEDGDGEGTQGELQAWIRGSHLVCQGLKETTSLTPGTEGPPGPKFPTACDAKIAHLQTPLSSTPWVQKHRPGSLPPPQPDLLPFHSLHSSSSCSLEGTLTRNPSRDVSGVAWTDTRKMPGVS